MRSMGYQAETGVLEIEFQSGEVYEYFDVPADVYVGLEKAESKGQYFNREIRDDYGYARKGKARGAGEAD